MGTWGPGAFENDAARDSVLAIQTAQDLADALTIRTRGGWAHHRCLNAALHPRHMIRVYKNDEPVDADELDRILKNEPSAED